MNVVITKANIEHAFSIMALTQELGYGVDELEIAARLRDLFKSETHGVFVARNEDGNICGWVVVEKRLSLEGGWKAEITGLVVGEAFRQLGIGRKLVAESECWANELGLSTLEVRSNIVRKEAQKFYKGTGFCLMKTSHKYEKRLKK